MNLLDGKLVSNNIKEKIRDEIKPYVHNLGLAIILIGNNIASKIYVRNKIKTFNSLDIKTFLYELDENIDEQKVIDLISKLNKDIRIQGIILQLPLPNHLNEYKLLNTIDINKDVDGLTSLNILRLIENFEEAIIPATPLGILTLLDFYNINVKGAHCVIVGRGQTVGKPLSYILTGNNKYGNATVTICHSYTKDLYKYTLESDILISAVGKKHIITANMVNDDSIIIDVGISRVDKKIFGDVDFDNVKNKVKYITPMPGGVGIMTVTSLLINLITLYKKQNNMIK